MLVNYFAHKYLVKRTNCLKYVSNNVNEKFSVLKRIVRGTLKRVVRGTLKRIVRGTLKRIVGGTLKRIVRGTLEDCGFHK